ncbi:putative transferase, protein kinase RLK-Pelle-RLCK-VIIa-2 family protein [Tanacetum coccineum]|uniref:Transferase, protein kinase RLK-Pelle-RLCK-VIIa-2 family protein n=1 Tax=Tanacetum coccineum TaxID=301880 RepID=A0ABQ5ETF3_9ASTR
MVSFLMLLVHSLLWTISTSNSDCSSCCDNDFKRVHTDVSWTPRLSNLVIFVLIILDIVVYKLRKLHEKSIPFSSEHPCRRFSLAEIQLATNNFDPETIIGKGGFGKVYKGFIDDGGTTIASKRLNYVSRQGASEIWTEVKMLSRARHGHLVSLIGYHNEFVEMMVVYEYILLANKQIITNYQLCVASRHQHVLVPPGFVCSAFGALVHLCIFVILCSAPVSKIGPMDQPCTHVSTDVKGSFGYFDLNYFLTRRLTRTSDVYSFGVVLLEVLCGRPAVDPSLKDDELGLTRPKDPPTMSEVVVELEAALALHKRGDYLVCSRYDNGPSHQSQVRRLQDLDQQHLDNLKVVTRNFSDDMVVGEGAFGKVFKGWVELETSVPSKIEVKLLSRLNHLNLVNLLGYCSEDKELLLIYEFMEKGDLDSYILKHEIYTRLDDEQGQRQLLAGRVNMLFRDRRGHAHTRLLMETEAGMSREAWGRAMDASDLAHGGVISLRTTVHAQMSEITELQSADRRRQRAISELLETDRRRREEMRELRAADRTRQQQIVQTLTVMQTLQREMVPLQGLVTTLQGQVTALQGQVMTLQGQVTTLQGQQGPAGGPAQLELPEEAGSSS